jgi:hypothetical protein
MNKDLEHLRWLSIAHFISGVIAFLFIGVTLLQLFGTFQEVKDIVETKNSNPAQKLDEIKTIMKIFAGVYISIEFIRIICTVIAGVFIKTQKHYIFCIVIAIINCAFFPIGTILGVFTLVVLFRVSVKPLFRENSVNPI